MLKLLLMNVLLKLFWTIIIDDAGGTLSMTRKTANTLATASGMNTNYDEIEAVVNGSIEAGNIAADAVTAAKLNSDVVRTNYGLLQHTDGSLYVDVYGVLVNAGTNGVEWGRAGDMLLSSSATTPDGFSDVSATYEGKFIRVSATALTAGGADTHTHAVGSYTGPSHTHTVTVPNQGWGQQVDETDGHIVSFQAGLAYTNRSPSPTDRVLTSAAGGTGAITGTSASGDNVPAFISLKMYKKS